MNIEIINITVDPVPLMVISAIAISALVALRRGYLRLRSAALTIEAGAPVESR